MGADNAELMKLERQSVKDKKFELQASHVKLGMRNAEKHFSSMNQIVRERSQDLGGSGGLGASPKDRQELRDKAKASNIVFNAVDKRYADYKDVKTQK